MGLPPAPLLPLAACTRLPYTPHPLTQSDAAQGPTADVVKKAKAEIKRLIEEATEKAMRRDAPAAGRYSVV